MSTSTPGARPHPGRSAHPGSQDDLSRNVSKLFGATSRPVELIPLGWQPGRAGHACVQGCWLLICQGCLRPPALTGHELLWGQFRCPSGEGSHGHNAKESVLVQGTVEHRGASAQRGGECPAAVSPILTSSREVGALCPRPVRKQAALALRPRPLPPPAGTARCLLLIRTHAAYLAWPGDGPRCRMEGGQQL